MLELAHKAIPLSEQRMREVKSLLRVAVEEEQNLQETVRGNTAQRAGKTCAAAIVMIGLLSC